MKRNHLFLIGIDEYLFVEPLQNACNDATKILEVLTEIYTFDRSDVCTLYNQAATTTAIQATLDRYSDTLTKEDNLVIYFAGHGYYHERRKTGYIVPVDGRKDETTNNQPVNFISFHELLRFVEAIDSHQTLLISDCCFSGNIFKERSRTLDVSTKSYGLLEEFAQKPCRYAITSGLIEKVSDGGFTDRNSPFAKALIESLRENPDPALSINSLGQSVQARVKLKVSNQTPWYGPLAVIGNEADFGGEFVFFKRALVKSNAISTTAETPKRAQPIELRQFFTEKAQIKTYNEIIDTYLKKQDVAFVPNAMLIHVMFEMVADFNEEAQLWIKREAQKAGTITPAKRRISILNALPAVVAEHFRKLMVPVADENKGYDKVNVARLEQLVMAQSMLLEYWLFASITAISEKLRLDYNLSFSPQLAKDIVKFIGQNRTFLPTKEATDLIQSLAKEYGLTFSPFSALEESAAFFEDLKQQLNRRSLATDDCLVLCQRCEEHLLRVMTYCTPLLFKYRLDTIKTITLEEDEQDGHIYEHNFVQLNDLLGGLSIYTLSLEYPLNVKSVVLFDKDLSGYLNLSPFYVDFPEHADEIVKLYSLQYFKVDSNELVFKSAFNSNTPLYYSTDKTYLKRVNNLMRLFQEHSNPGGTTS